MKFIAYTIAVLLALYVGYKWYHPTYSWHQKMTVEVETPDGRLHTGASTTEMLVSFVPQLLPEMRRFERKFRGEAVVVELPDKRYLIAVLKEGQYLAERVFQPMISDKYASKEYFASIARLRGSREITPKHIRFHSR